MDRFYSNYRIGTFGLSYFSPSIALSSEVMLRGGGGSCPVTGGCDRAESDRLRLSAVGVSTSGTRAYPGVQF